MPVGRHARTPILIKSRESVCQGLLQRSARRLAAPLRSSSVPAAARLTPAPPQPTEYLCPHSGVAQCCVAQPRTAPNLQHAPSSKCPRPAIACPMGNDGGAGVRSTGHFATPFNSTPKPLTALLIRWYILRRYKAVGTTERNNYALQK